MGGKKKKKKKKKNSAYLDLCLSAFLPWTPFLGIKKSMKSNINIHIR